MIKLADGRSLTGIIGELVRRSFDFGGRSQRTDGLLWYLSYTVLSWLTYEGAWLIHDATPQFELGFWLSEIVYGLLALPFVGWSVRRLHDFGQSGWWALSLIPPALVNPYWSDWRMAGVVTLLGGCVLLALLLWPPHRHANRYGSDPRAIPETTERVTLL